MARVVAIIGGTGPEGKGLATRWARAGETIIVGSRDAARAAEVAAAVVEEIAADTGAAVRVTGMENNAAVAAANVVVLTVPFSGQAAILKQLKPAFQPGTVVIDTTVPLAACVGGRATRVLGVWQGSAVQQTAELLPKSIAVAGALQNLSAELLRGAARVECDVIVSSDDDRAKQVASELAELIPGVRAVNGGPLESARIVEQITALLIQINIQYKVHHAGLRITGVIPDQKQPDK
jgi:NADPH-dependent F420 reductase